jgi:branched-chain amino acid transport system permease protein
VALVFPQRTTPYPHLPAPPDLRLGDLMLRGDDAVTLAVALAVLGLLWLLIYRTQFGLEMRALADSAEAARIARVNTPRVAFLTFLLAGGIGAIAGILIAGSDGQISPKFGLWATMKGLIAMMIGGLGSLRGALLGGLALGIIEAHAQWYLGAQSREMIVYGLLFAFLILLPGGLAGVRDTGAARKL